MEEAEEEIQTQEAIPLREETWATEEEGSGSEDKVGMAEEEAEEIVLRVPLPWTLATQRMNGLSVVVVVVVERGKERGE